MNYPHNDGSPLCRKWIKGSISHLKEKWLFVLVFLQSVSIDIENCSRKINQSILKKISHLQELHQSNNFENCSSKDAFLFKRSCP